MQREQDCSDGYSLRRAAPGCKSTPNHAAQGPAGLSSEGPYRNPQGMQILERLAGPPPPSLLCLLRPNEHFGAAGLSPSLLSVPRAPLLPSRGPWWVLHAPASSQTPPVSPGRGHRCAVLPRWARSHQVLLGGACSLRQVQTTGRAPEAGGFCFPSPPKLLRQDSVEAQQVLLVPAVSAKHPLFFSADSPHSIWET